MKNIVIYLFLLTLIACKEHVSTVHLHMTPIDSLDDMRARQLLNMKDDQMGLTVYRSINSKTNFSSKAVDPQLMKTGNDLWLQLSIYHSSLLPLNDTQYRIVCDDTTFIINPNNSVVFTHKIDDIYYSWYELTDYAELPLLVKSIAVSDTAIVFFSGNTIDYDTIRQKEKDACADIYYMFTGEKNMGNMFP